jgi:hypothetical protein
MASRVFRKAALDRLSSPEQLDQLVQVTNPQGWGALSILVGLLLAAFFWGVLGSLPMEVAGEGTLRPGAPANVSPSPARGGGLLAVLLLTADAGENVRVGMEVHVRPASLKTEGVGFIPGRVVRVVHGLWTQVEVALERDAKGDQVLMAGMRVFGKIVVRRDRPLALLLPILRRRTNH